MENINTQKQKINFLKNILTVLFFLLVFSFSRDASAAGLTKPVNNLGLVSYWSFNDATSTTATDSSGNGNTGTLNNMSNPGTATSGWGTGKLGAGLNFDGVDDCVSASDSQMSSGSSARSISFWFKSAVIGNGVAKFAVGYGASSGNDLYAVGIQRSDASGGVALYASTQTTGIRSTAAASIIDGNWHHAVVVYNGTTEFFYLDGVSLGSSSHTVITTLPGTLYIGRISSAGFNWAGSIDEVRIYNRALSSVAEVTSLYKAGATKLSVFNPSKINGLTTWLKADAITGLNDGDEVASWTDSSGSGNTATQSGTGIKPLYKTNILNGLPTVRFDGVGDYMSIPSTSVGTVFVVGEWSGASTFPSFNGLYTHGGYETLIGNSGTTNIYNSGTAAGLVPTRYIDGQASISVTPINNWHLFEFKGNVATGAGVIGRDRTFSGRYWNGDIAEVIVYNTKLSDADRRRVEYYLNTKYAMGLNIQAPQKINASRNVTGTSLDSGLVGLWSFDGKDMNGTTAYDRSGLGNNGTLTNGPTVTIGKIGQALSFNGSNGYVSASNSPSMNSSSLTVCAWVMPTTFSNYQNIFAKNNGSYEQIGLLVNSSGQIAFQLGNNNATFAGSLTLNAWNFVCGSTNASTGTLYINGSAIRTETNSGAYNATTPFVIGATSYASYSRFFNGAIDDVRVYNRALSASEIQLLYNFGK